MNTQRIRSLNAHNYTKGAVLYWMDREMRAHQNWALVRVLELSKQHKAPIVVVYNLVKDYLGGGARQYEFKLGGLKELEATFKSKNIPFTVLLTSNSVSDMAAFCASQKIGFIVTDMNPLRVNQQWKQRLAKRVSIPMEEVDAHNVVPVWEASQKQEFAARTIRPKIHKQLSQYLDEFPTLSKQSQYKTSIKPIPWKLLLSAKTDTSVKPVDWIEPGEKAAKKMLKSFIAKRLPGYATKRNDPNENHLSSLSPYFHYGMISPQYAVMEVMQSDAHKADKDVFIEEAIVRRELSDNFCFYNPHYDSFKGFPAWAQKTLNKHRPNKREYIYSLKTFEQAKTHDPLWNAAQRQMLLTGKMHGYMRMYWAKKILEWTKTPETALKFAIHLNDKYELDGRDPNGYVGCAWSIGGVHDRPWFERRVFGTVRYMNDNGCARKFDVKKYIQTWGQPTLI